MRDSKFRSLRREFLTVGLTGTMVGLAGCTDSINIETSSEDEDENTENTTPDIDTASFSFEYDNEAQQVEIEFTEGDRINAGNLQLRQENGPDVLWAELGSTTAGPDEAIESGSTAVLGPEILNWETPIESDDQIRLIYVGKETPATLERYSPPEQTNTTTTVPASISNFTVTNSSEQQLQVSFNSTKQLETIDVEISGAESTAIARSNFTESAPSNGTYTYTTSYETSSNGSYTATIAQAADINGTNALNGENITDTASINIEQQPADSSPPSISAFSAANPTGQQLRVSFESNEELASIQVNVTGAESTSLNKSRFSQTASENQTYTYEETLQVSSDGEYTATLETAADEAENDGSSGQSASVSVRNIDSDMTLSFEDGSVGGTTPPSPWYELDNFGGEIQITDERATQGTNSLYIAGQGGGTNDNAQRDINIAVDIDVTNVAEIRVDAFVEQNSNSAGELQAHLIEDGNYTGNQIMGWTQEATGWHRDSSADVSDVTGQRVFYLHTDGSGNRAFFDNVRFYDDNGELIPVSDVLVSSAKTALSFEDGSVGETTPPSPWYELDNYGGEIRITDERATEGTNSLYIAGQGGGTNDNAQRDINIAIDIDASQVGEIRVDAFVEQNSNSAGELQAHLIEDGNYTGNQIMGWTQKATGWHRDTSTDVSDVTGQRVFYLHTDGSGNRAYFDNIRFYDGNGELIPVSDVLVSS